MIQNSLNKDLNGDKIERFDSPDYDQMYFSDTDLYLHNVPKHKTLKTPANRGGGFKVKQAKQEYTNDVITSGMKKAQMKRLSLGGDQDQEQIVSANNFGYFCPKRFNRYPRFTIFFNKDQNGGNDGQNPPENTVSLGPQFLSYLMNRSKDMKTTIDENVHQETIP